MNHSEPKRLEIERYVAKELNEEKCRSLEIHFKECMVCNSYMQSLIQKRKTFLNVYPFESMCSERPKNAGSSWITKITEVITRPVLVPVFASLLIALIIIPVAYNKGYFSSSDAIGYKGNAAISFVYQRNGITMPGTVSGIYKDGDILQILYSSDQDQYVSLLSIDASGNVSFYHPDQTASDCSIKAEKGNGIAYPGSIILDNAKGHELIIALFSSEPLRQSDVSDWISKSYHKDRNLPTLINKIKNVPLKNVSSVQTILLSKGA